MSWDFGIFLVGACARLCESSTASGANVGDITPGILPLFITNICVIYVELYVQDIKKASRQQLQARIYAPGPD
jgi:hypothetical protein